MRGRVNAYLAMLFIAIAGAGATFLIVHIANANTLEITFNGSEADYISLKQSILRK